MLPRFLQYKNVHKSRLEILSLLKGAVCACCSEGINLLLEMKLSVSCQCALPAQKANCVVLDMLKKKKKRQHSQQGERGFSPSALLL